MLRSQTAIAWRVQPVRKLWRGCYPASTGAGSNDPGTGSDTDTSNDTAGQDDQTGDDSSTDDPTRPKYTDSDMAKLRRKMQKEFADKEARAKQEAEDASLTEQGKAKELAARYKQQIDADAPRLERFAEIVTEIVEAQTASWPDSVKKLIPAEGDPVARYEAYNSAKDVAADLIAAKAQGSSQQTQPSTPAGNRENPKPASTQGGPASMERNEALARIRSMA